MKAYLIAEVKSTASEDPNGTFEAILSAPTVDRDGEVIVAKAFEPLPAQLPIHAFHNFNDPVGVAEPYYDGDVLKATGRFASTSRAQEVRQLVVDDVIQRMSVGFMDAKREEIDGVPHITKAELLEASFVSIPSNREAAILSAKDYDVKVGARNSGKDGERLQTIHDLAVANGAVCTATDDHTPDDDKGTAPETPAPAGKSPASEAALLYLRALADQAATP